MKITRSQLRQIIRESLIKELTPDIITDPVRAHVASNQIASANPVPGVADTIANALGLPSDGIVMKTIKNKLANEPVEFVVSLGAYTTEELMQWYKDNVESEPGPIEELISKQLRQIIKEELNRLEEGQLMNIVSTVSPLATSLQMALQDGGDPNLIIIGRILNELVSTTTIGQVYGKDNDALQARLAVLKRYIDNTSRA
jgi:hypothetical protein